MFLSSTLNSDSFSLYVMLLYKGTSASFRKVYEEPILVSKQPSCTSEERRIGEERAQELNRLTSSFILRRTSDVNKQYLPQKSRFSIPDPSKLGAPVTL